MPDLAALARGCLPAAARVAWADPQTAYPLLAGEALPGAVRHRLREFSAGRHAARAALRALGQPTLALPMGDDRAPVWPEGVTGSITHSGTACLAACVPQQVLRGLGLDLEEDTDLDRDLWDTVLLPAEQAALSRLAPDQGGRMAKAVFSAKEAAYKAQYGQSRTLFGFDTLQVQIEGARFTARFCHPVAPFAAGQPIHGSVVWADGHVLTVASLPA